MSKVAKAKQLNSKRNIEDKDMSVQSGKSHKRTRSNVDQSEKVTVDKSEAKLSKREVKRKIDFGKSKVIANEEPKRGANSKYRQTNNNVMHAVLPILRSRVNTSENSETD